MTTRKQKLVGRTELDTYTITLRVQGLYLLEFTPRDDYATFGLVPVPAEADPHTTSFRVTYENGEEGPPLERFLSYNTITYLDAKIPDSTKEISRKKNGKDPQNGGIIEDDFNFEHALHFYTHLFSHHSNPKGRKPLTLKPEVLKGRLRLARGEFSVSKVFGARQNPNDENSPVVPMEVTFREKGRSPVITKRFVAEEIKVVMEFSKSETVFLDDGKPNPYEFKKKHCTLLLTNKCDLLPEKCHQDFIHLYKAIELPDSVLPILPPEIRYRTTGTSVCGGGCTC